MSDVEDRYNKVLEHNISDVLENGPRLSSNRQTALIAKCPTGKHALIVGLGAMGVGIMWITAETRELDDVLWGELPVQPCEDPECKALRSQD